MSITINDICSKGALNKNFPWSLYKATGKDRINFFHGQTTNDLKKLDLNTSQISSRVDYKGRIQSYFYFVNKSEELLLLIPKILETEAIADFEKFIIMDDVQITLLRQELFLCLGPISVLAQKEILADEGFLIEYYDGPALVFWDDKNLQLLQEKFQLPLINDDDVEGLRLLSGFPLWKKEIDFTTLLSDSYLEKISVSYSKGCYVGQETLAKINTNRGAAYFPVLLELVEEIDVKDFSIFDQQNFYINDKKAGKINGIIKWDEKIYFQANLFRQFRIESKIYPVAFKKIENISNELVLQIKVRYLPYFQGHNIKSKAIWLYDQALSCYTHKNQAAEAINLLKLALELNPVFEDAYESLGVILGQLERFDEAIEIMKTLSSINSQLVMPHTNLSLFYMKIGLIEEAENEKAIATVKTFESFSPLQEDSKNNNDDLDRRELMFLQVLDIDPDDPLANCGLGEINLTKTNLNLAITYLDKAIFSDPRYSTAYLLLGKTYEGLKELGKARETYEKGIEIAASKGELMPANEMQNRLEQIIEALKQI